MSSKKTLLNILMGMIKPSSGSFHLQEGISMGMSVSRKGFFDDMTVQKNIQLQAKLMRASDADLAATMETFNIDFGNTLFGNLSAGMKQKVSLMLPFTRNNHLIFLDEPSNHLDIDSLLNLRAIILQRKQKGVSFLIASHILSDLEKVSDRILFIKNGAISSDMVMGKLLAQYGTLEEAYLRVQR